MAGTYTVRTTQPTGNLPEYSSIQGSITPAWNGSIVGNGGQAGANVLFNCVGYSQGRLIEMHNEIFPDNKIMSFASNIYNIFSGNAEDWWQAAIDAGYNTGQVPKAGAVGVYYDPANNTGHVVNVEKFDTVNNRWDITESHYYYPNNQGSWDYSYLDSNYFPAFISGHASYQLYGFIYPFDNVTPVPPRPPGPGQKPINWVIYNRFIF